MARPQKEIQKKKKNCIMLRLSDTEYEIVTNYAKEAGYPPAVYARKQILEGQVKIECPIIVDIEELRKLTAEFGKIGSNLNQIAKSSLVSEALINSSKVEKFCSSSGAS